MIVDNKFVGKIVFIGEEEKVGQNNIRKQTFVIEEVSDKEYRGTLAIDLIKDRVDMLKDLKKGDKVSCLLNFRANEYNGKYYNSINARSVKKIDEGGSDSLMYDTLEDENDLPF